MENRIETLWDFITERGIATSVELDLITCINGNKEETLNAVIYVRTGYRSMEQLQEEENEE